MRWSFRRGRSRADSMLGAYLAAWRTDEFVDSYACWRAESEAVRIAYGRWRGEQPPDQRLAFAAYRVALDREERAALVFRECAEPVYGAQT